MGCETVTLEDVVASPSGLRRTGPVTTAHGQVARFYRERLTPTRPPSIAETLARAVSPFSVDALLQDALRFTSADRKQRDSWLLIAAARKAELRGEVFVA